MLHVAHESRLDAPKKGGGTERKHLEVLLRSDSAAARNLATGRLEAPPVPEGMEYLRLWARELCGRSGAGVDGLAPLSFTTIKDWSLLTGHSPTPEEVDALMLLDGILRHPPEEEVSEATDG